MQLWKPENSKFYHYDFRVDGKRYRGSTKETTKNKAKEFVEAVHGRIRRDFIATTSGERKPISLNDAFDRLIKGTDGKNTNLSYDLAKRKFLGGRGFEKVWHLPKDIMCHDITDQHIDDMKMYRKEEGLTNNSINVEIRSLKRVLNLTKRLYLVNEQLELKELPKFTKTRYLTIDEEKALIDQLQGKDSASYHKAHDLCVFLIDTGVRLSEALNARWDDIDFENKTFEVYRLKTKSLSIVPLTNRVIAMLKNRMAEPQPFDQMSRAVRQLRKSMDTVCNNDPRLNEQRGKATPHSLRDTYASRLVKRGMSLHQLSKLLGHTTAQMSNKYSHLEHADVVNLAREILDA